MLPRNTSDLAKLPEKYAADVSSLSAEAKRETILSQPAGVILFFPGHVMIYYGSDGNDLLCLSAAGKFAPVQSSATQNVYTVEVCSLDVRLSNGKTWLEAVEKIIRILYCNFTCRCSASPLQLLLSQGQQLYSRTVYKRLQSVWKEIQSSQESLAMQGIPEE